MDTTLKQTLEHKISQKMIQSVNILQMNSQELNDYIKQISLENPFIDVNDEFEYRKNEDTIKISEYNISSFELQNVDYSLSSDENSFENIYVPQEETLCENLLSQLLCGDYTKEEREIFFYIATSLDNNGYFPGGICELMEVFNINYEKAKYCLNIMKSLDPKGVCAENLIECLKLQLDERDNYHIEYEIVSFYLDLLGKNNLRKISELLKVDIKSVLKAKNNISKLNPKPSQGFSERSILKYITPDIVIVKFKDHFNIVSNNFNTLNINFDYISTLKDNSFDKTLLNYIDKKLDELETLQNSICMRNNTLLKLTEYILELQKDFFLYGKGNLKPCKMKDAAKSLELSESTICRAVNGKYLQCCHGLFPLGYFFSKSSYKINKNESTTIDNIKSIIKNIIDTENKNKPFSDQKITELLHSRDINISRRTVAQYRDSLSIPDCRIRKLY